MSSETRLTSENFQDMSQDTESDQKRKYLDRIHNVRPGPGRDNSTSNQTGLYGSSSRAEHLRGLNLRVVPLKDISGCYHPKGKGKAQSEHDAITEAST